MSVEVSRINKYRQSTFHQTKTSNEIELNTVPEEAGTKNPLERILCSLRFRDLLDSVVSIPALLLVWITWYVIPATSTHGAESVLWEGEAEGEFHE